jgi:copper homeostasis protein (lipoprotein)
MRQLLRLTTPLAVAFLLAVAPVRAVAQSIHGAANYLAGRGLPQGAVLEVMLDDVSQVGAPPRVIAQVRVLDPGPSPIQFTIFYDEALIDPAGSYGLRARIVRGERTLQVAAAVPLREMRIDEPITLRPYQDIAIGSAAGTDQILGKKPATFMGVVPCADCSGYDLQLDFYEDHAYASRLRARDKGTETDQIGRWLPSSDGSTIALRSGSETVHRFAIIDPNRLRPIDGNGKPLEPTPGRDLVRSPGADIVRPKLSMRGLYRIDGSTARFRECLTGRIWPVAREAAAESLASAYGGAKVAPGEDVLVAVDGQIAARPRTDGPGLTASLVVERVIRVARGEACADVTSASLEDVEWTLIEVGGHPVAVPATRRAPRIRMAANGQRLTGWGGCNTLTGTYERRESELRFGQITGALLGCPDTGAIEDAFLRAIAATRSFRITGRTLELVDASGLLVARLEAVPR